MGRDLAAFDDIWAPLRERIEGEWRTSVSEDQVARRELEAAKARNQEMRCELLARQAERIAAERAVSSAEERANSAKDALFWAERRAVVADAAAGHKTAELAQLSECAQLVQQQVRHLHQDAFTFKDEFERVRQDFCQAEATHLEVVSATAAENEMLRKNLDEARRQLVERERDGNVLMSKAAGLNCAAVSARNNATSNVARLSGMQRTCNEARQQEALLTNEAQVLTVTPRASVAAANVDTRAAAARVEVQRRLQDAKRRIAFEAEVNAQRRPGTSASSVETSLAQPQPHLPEPQKQVLRQQLRTQSHSQLQPQQQRMHQPQRQLRQQQRSRHAQSARCLQQVQQSRPPTLRKQHSSLPLGMRLPAHFENFEIT